MDGLRRLLALLLFAVGLVGLMPLLPKAVGYTSAVVNNYTAGTFFPVTTPPGGSARFVYCTQDPDPNTVKKKNGNHTGNYFRCTNNWGSAVTINFSAVTGGTSSGITVSGSVNLPAGAQGVCASATITTPGGAGGSAGSVRYRGTIDQADLYAVIEWDGYLDVANNPTPATCTP